MSGATAEVCAVGGARGRDLGNTALGVPDTSQTLTLEKLDICFKFTNKSEF